MIIRINTDVWATPSQYAEETGNKRSTVSMWIKREKVEVWHIKELGIKLIKRKSKK